MVSFSACVQRIRGITASLIRFSLLLMSHFSAVSSQGCRGAALTVSRILYCRPCGGNTKITSCPVFQAIIACYFCAS
ncbi:hypothetical protein AC03_4650 [Escherichia coli 3-073-06_S3_C1]|nr:hypothetical protein AC50_4874 [Escherichia coli 2-474-04_S3_C3]KDZ59033.1 hypothetical protein AC03_4650 [Escherichia coli 3-073-06_S3_C1]KDZ59676.1 hypothetical protein AC31_4720 [Escherichia coli 3-073-06_S3_C2]